MSNIVPSKGRSISLWTNDGILQPFGQLSPGGRRRASEQFEKLIRIYIETQASMQIIGGMSKSAQETYLMTLADMYADFEAMRAKIPLLSDSLLNQFLDDAERLRPVIMRSLEQGIQQIQDVSEQPSQPNGPDFRESLKNFLYWMRERVS